MIWVEMNDFILLKMSFNSTFQLQANPNQLMLQIMQFIQHNHDNSQGIQAPNNQGQIGQTININPSTQEILQLLDKFLAYQAKNDDEKEALENIKQAKKELRNKNEENAKSFLNKALFMFQDPAVQISLGLVTNYAFEILKPFLGLK